MYFIVKMYCIFYIFLFTTVNLKQKQKRKTMDKNGLLAGILTPNPPLCILAQDIRLGRWGNNSNSDNVRLGGFSQECLLYRQDVVNNVRLEREHINKVTRGRSPLCSLHRAQRCIAAAGMWKGSEDTNQNKPHTESPSTKGALHNPQNTPPSFVFGTYQLQRIQFAVQGNSLSFGSNIISPWLWVSYFFFFFCSTIQSCLLTHFLSTNINLPGYRPIFFILSVNLLNFHMRNHIGVLRNANGAFPDLFIMSSPFPNSGLWKGPKDAASSIVLGTSPARPAKSFQSRASKSS